MQTIKMTILIKADVSSVWEALTDPDVIARWGAGPAEMTDQEGTNFSLWKGDIHGRNLYVVPEEKLVQEWYAGKWDQPSKVTLTLAPIDKGVQIDLLHENVPDNEVKEIKQGWEDYYLGPMKEYLESHKESENFE